MGVGALIIYLEQAAGSSSWALEVGRAGPCCRAVVLQLQLWALGSGAVTFTLR